MSKVSTYRRLVCNIKQQHLPLLRWVFQRANAEGCSVSHYLRRLIEQDMDANKYDDQLKK